MDIHEVIRHGIISEKSVDAQNTQRVRGPNSGEIVPRYTFRVALEATKPQIKQAVEQLFNVKVVKVNTMRLPGKRHRIMTRKGVFHSEAREWKKAIVTIQSGQSIPEMQA
ncbi:MAG TPA: 50S ribosomal protein L23 [Ktedonobacterales bacterium]|jgi:large subunit ribosomal protein L23